jgi:hypothetical protein
LIYPFQNGDFPSFFLNVYQAGYVSIVESVATSLAVGGCRPGPAVLGRQVEPEELEDAVGAGRGKGMERTWDNLK